MAVVDGSIRGSKNVAIVNNSQDQDLSLGISSKDFITDPWLSVSKYGIDRPFQELVALMSKAAKVARAPPNEIPSYINVCNPIFAKKMSCA